MTCDFSIRPACADDKLAISALFARSYPNLLAADYDPETLDNVLPLITSARPELLACGTYYVAEDSGGQLICAGGWTDCSPARGIYGPREGHVRHVATDPSRVRQGLASVLLEAALRSARAMGMYRLHCMSTRTARGFYQAMGFHPTGEVDLTLAPGVHFPVVQMRCDL